MEMVCLGPLHIGARARRLHKLHVMRIIRQLMFFMLAAAPVLSDFSSAESAPTMKAVVIHGYGGPQVLKYEHVRQPEPKDDQLLIRVIAAGVNPVDAMIRSGMFDKEGNRAFPIILGGDVAGVVEKVGRKITKFKAGDPVFAYVSLDNSGGYAEYALVTEREAAPKPKSLTYVEAAAVPIAGMTAWQALVNTAKLSAGQTVLIHGGSGGVGSFAIQIAKARGAKVIATASTANQEFLKQLGADVAIDYTKQKFEDIAKDVDVVLDSIGRDTLARSYGVVKKGGIIVSLVARPKESDLQKNGIRGTALNVEPDSEELVEIGKLIDARKIKVIVSQTFPLSQAIKAQEQVATGHTRGKIVLKISDEPK
jgi:NADPH:quinone reductase-like Zn-dependent oxidoreductase